jgi:poly(3-hydroxybutyrate) depolymerase
MFTGGTLRFAAASGVAALLLAACGTGSDVEFPGDTQNLFPSGDSGSGKDGGTKPTGDDGGPHTDAGKDAGKPSDPNYPYDVSYETVNAGGKTHDFIVITPQHPTKASLPIIFGYHGDGGGAQGSKDYFQVEKTTQQNAIIVYPSCPANPAWNIYGGASNEYLAAFDATLTQVAGEHGGDLTKVTAFGLSSGAFFSSVLGCFRSAKLQAVGIMAGGAPFQADGTTLWVDGQDSTTHCPGQAPVPVFVVHDYADPVVPYDSGRWASEYYLYANRASAPGGSWSGNADNTSDVFGGLCKNRNEAPPGAPVVLCSVSNVGHALWDQFLPTFWQFSSAL